MALRLTEEHCGCTGELSGVNVCNCVNVKKGGDCEVGAPISNLILQQLRTPELNVQMGDKLRGKTKG